jgi:Fe2+ transport system protein B
LDYIFYGSHRLDERCRQFFDDMEANFLLLPSFYGIFLLLVCLFSLVLISFMNYAGEAEDRIADARDHFEHFVMQHIAEQAFKFSQVPAEDDELLHRMKVLSFLTPQVSSV